MVEPTDEAGLCSQVKRCFVGWRIPNTRDVVKAVTKCTGVELATPASEGSGFLSTAVLGVEAPLDEDRVSVTWFLVAKRPDGDCLVDLLLGPDAGLGSFTSDFTFAWTGTAESLHFQVHAHSAYHQALDQDELEGMAANHIPRGEDGPDVASQYCTHYAYVVKDGTFKRVRAKEVDGACKQNRAAPRLHL